jgi:V/A-type H+-transporting ATPase subunit F
MSQQKSNTTTGKIAVVGERELAIGYNLLGIEDTFITSGDEASKTIQDLFSSGTYSLIIISDAVRASLPAIFRKKIEASIEPLVIFMPALEGNIQEESISVLAKRVLGISIPSS